MTFIPPPVELNTVQPAPLTKQERMKEKRRKRKEHQRCKKAQFEVLKNAIFGGNGSSTAENSGCD